MITISLSSGDNDLKSSDNEQDELQLITAFPELEFNQITEMKSFDNSIFIVQKTGEIFYFDDYYSVQTKSLLLNLSSKLISDRFEQGLLGFDLDPSFNENGYFYVYYTSPNNDSVIERFNVDLDTFETVLSSNLTILVIPQPHATHNGGKLLFGPDDLLYIGVGDGNYLVDTQNNGQDRTTLLGAMLRIDVSSSNVNIPYTIPSDNPFAGNSDGFREEIYAYGLRNPWKFSFDPLTNVLWLGDPGTSRQEEVNIIEKGKNYGWKIMEGFNCFKATTCNTTELTTPIYSYPRINGLAAIIGGHVYRGNTFNSISGKYVYGDFTGKLWALDYNGTTVVNNSEIGNMNLSLTSIELDSQGEILFSSLGGSILRFKGTEPTLIPSNTIVVEPVTTTSRAETSNFLNMSIPLIFVWSVKRIKRDSTVI